MKNRTITVISCACGATQAWDNLQSGRLSRAATTLVSLFRHFHELHGAVTVQTRDKPLSRCTQREGA